MCEKSCIRKAHDHVDPAPWQENKYILEELEEKLIKLRKRIEKIEKQDLVLSREKVVEFIQEWKEMSQYWYDRADNAENNNYKTGKAEIYALVAGELGRELREKDRQRVNEVLELK